LNTKKKSVLLVGYGCNKLHVSDRCYVCEFTHIGEGVLVARRWWLREEQTLPGALLIILLEEMKEETVPQTPPSITLPCIHKQQRSLIEDTLVASGGWLWRVCHEHFPLIPLSTHNKNIIDSDYFKNIQDTSHTYIHKPINVY
jgi:hypothetical protein